MFDDYMAVISLGAPIVLEFRRNRKAIPLFIPGNSLLIMSGEARYAWTHGIASRRLDMVDGALLRRGTRVSLTFRRTLAEGRVCGCAWPELCDRGDPEQQPRGIRLACSGNVAPSGTLDLQ